MPRKPRITIPGCYHVINRGVNRENIFLVDEDNGGYGTLFNCLTGCDQVNDFFSYTHCLRREML